MDVIVKLLLSFLISTLWRLFRLSERLGTDEDIAVNAVGDLWRKREQVPRGFVRRQLMREGLYAVVLAGLISLALLGVSAIVPPPSDGTFASQTQEDESQIGEPECSVPTNALLGRYVGNVAGATTVLTITRVGTSGASANMSYSLVSGGLREIRRDDGAVRLSDCSIVIPALRPLDGRIAIRGKSTIISSSEPVWKLEQRAQ